jgi:hypothetical protein
MSNFLLSVNNDKYLTASDVLCNVHETQFLTVNILFRRPHFIVLSRAFLAARAQPVQLQLRTIDREYFLIDFGFPLPANDLTPIP